MNDKITCLALLSLVLLSACEQKTGTETNTTDPTPVIARAAGITFHESDLDREIQAMPDPLHHIASDPVARSQILNVLIRRSILSQHAQEIGLENDPLISSQINRARNTILIEALENWQTSQLSSPAEQEIANYYKQHLIDFTIPEQIHARHILIGTEKLAWEITKKLKRNRDSFEVLAITHSLDDSNKSRGGDLNWFPRGIMVEAFEKEAFALPVHGLSKPIKTQFGWHIIETLGKRPSHTKSLTESRDEIANLLQQKTLEQWIDKMISKAKVTIIKPEYKISEQTAIEATH